MKADIVYKFEKTYGDESDAIFRFCLIRVSNREQARDLVQETFLRLWQSMNKQEEIINTRAFLFTVAHRLIIDWYRKKKSISLESIIHKDTESEYDIVDEKTIDSLGFGAEGRHLLGKIKKLSGGDRNPVYMRLVEDLSPGEIGEILGISTNAASVRINRGIAELRKISGYEEDKENKK